MIKKYENKSGKRVVCVCKQCNNSFETLQLKVNAGKELFCSASCYSNFRTDNKKNRDEVFDNKMYQKKYKYNLSKIDYLDFLKAQENKCAICQETFKNTNRYDAPCVDHCHITSKVRGLLCHTCNKSLGGFKDNKELLLKAIVYLETTYTHGPLA